MTIVQRVLLALYAFLVINVAAAAGMKSDDLVIDRVLRQKRQGYGRPFGVPGGGGPREVVVEEVINRGGPPYGEYYNGDYYNGGIGGGNYYNGGGWQRRGGFRPGWEWRQPSTTIIEKEIIRTPGK